jgi:hypothetical protein
VAFCLPLLPSLILLRLLDDKKLCFGLKDRQDEDTLRHVDLKVEADGEGSLETDIDCASRSYIASASGFELEQVCSFCKHLS